MSYSSQLVESAISGDKQAFEQLLKYESEKLYKIAYLHMRNKEDALDVLQEATYKAYISIHQIKSPTYFSTWLVKILIRTAYKELERKKKLIHLPEETILFLLETNQVPDASIDLSDALATLSVDYRNVITLFYYYELPIRTIANVLNKPQATVKTYLRRAKLELKKTLGDEFYAKKLI